MSTTCWKALNSPALTKSNTTLQPFDGHNFLPKGVLPKFSIELAGKTIYFNFEFVNTTLDYNIFLGVFVFMPRPQSSHLYTTSFESFPNDTKIVTIDQLDCCIPPTQISSTGH